MPLWTFYAHIGHRGAKIPVLTINRYPTDWLEMKAFMVEAFKKVYMDYGVVEAFWTLERHVSSKHKPWRPRLGSYIPKPFSYKRMFEAFFTAEFNPNREEVDVKQFFSVRYGMVADYRAVERGVKWKVAPVVPKTFKSLRENPNSIFEEFSSVRYPDYSKASTLKYAVHPQHYSQSNFVRQYLPFGEKVRESQSAT